jgi:hypothetical protein
MCKVFIYGGSNKMIIQIPLSNDEYEEASKKAAEMKISPAQYIRIASVGDQFGFMSIYNQLLKDVEHMESGKLFVINDAIPDWGEMDVSLRAAVTKNFNHAIDHYSIGVERAETNDYGQRVYRRM